MNDLLMNLERLHSTALGIERIKTNLALDVSDDEVITWCKEKIKLISAVIYKKGKNWYIEVDHLILTVNSYNYCIITAHKM